MGILRSIVILSIAIMMISSVMVLSFGVDDAFAGKGVKKVFVTGLLSGVKVDLVSCFATTNVENPGPTFLAKGNGVVHLDLQPDANGNPPTSALIECTKVGSGTATFTVSTTELAAKPPFKFILNF